MSQLLDQLFKDKSPIFVNQLTENWEIFTGFETRNKYEILDSDGNKLGFIAEKKGGILSVLLRLILRTRRPMEIKVWNEERKEVLHFKRPFYWLFSSLLVTCQGRRVGTVERRFVLLTKTYDLCTPSGRLIAQIKAGIFNMFSFPLFDPRGKRIGEVCKEHGSLIKELATDADKFCVKLPAGWNGVYKALLLATAITIDLDYFEDNQGLRFGR